MKTTAMTTTKKKKCGLFRKIMTGAGIMSAMASMSATTAFASFGEDVKVTANGGTDASTMMGKIIGILLTITRFVGVALVVYGVYEVVMSFMQNQPEANEEERRSEEIYHSGSVTTEGGRHKIHCLTIIGQIEGHYILPPQNKTTKYEHVIHLLADAGIVGQHFIVQTCGRAVRKFFPHTLEKGFGIGKLLCIAIGIGDAAYQRLVPRHVLPLDIQIIGRTVICDEFVTRAVVGEMT